MVDSSLISASPEPPSTPVSGTGAEGEGIARNDHPDRMNVLFLASEAEPFVKIGGLADVAGSLPLALKRLSRTTNTNSNHIDIRLVIPYHPQIRKERYASQLVAQYPVQTVQGEIQVTAYLLDEKSLPVYLISGEPIDLETGVYSADLEADGFKYVFFSMACLELARRLGWKPDILHANDWHTAAAVYSLALHRSVDQFFKRTSSLLTIHNLPYLGSMTSPALEAFGLPPADHSDLPSWARHMALPLGLLAADAIVAVSPGYAREILTEEFGSGLDSFLRAHSEKLCGILNGLDIDRWDPTRDQEIKVNFTIDNLPARSANKSFLQEQLGLDIDPRLPVLAMVTRMDPQKGVDLAVAAIRSLLKTTNPNDNRPQIVFLGTGNPVLEDEVEKLGQDYPHTVRARIEFSEKLGHYIYGGADMLLMPSRYEPCGLSQMIAMHYGCVPIARATGGLYDTIQDPAESEESTGFLFTAPSPKALEHAIRKALNVFSQDPVAWQAMQTRGMQQDFSWDRSAKEYLTLYKALVERIKV